MSHHFLDYLRLTSLQFLSMRVSGSFVLITFLLCNACSPADQFINTVPLPMPTDLPFIEGRPSNLQSPFVTAGNRVYMIGYQDGSFADLGWHIKGEMGGVWDHPVKLLDGFSASLKMDDAEYCLDSAVAFVNYPIGNEHSFLWKNGAIDIRRFQFVPDNIEGLVVEYKLINKNAGRRRVILCITPKSDLRPAWLADSLHIVNGQDEVRYDPKTSTLVFKDRDNPWYAMIGSDRSGKQIENHHPCTAAHATDKGVTGTLCFEAVLEPGREYAIPLYISGSSESEDAAAKSLDLLRDSAGQLLADKTARFRKMAQRSAIDIPDKGISEMYDWLKYNIDWMVREVPSEGKGLSAGLPDYPWWFGADATYSLHGVLATGDHELVKSTIRLLNNVSKRTNRNGRIIHEVSTNGVVYNRGNVNETAQFITLVYNYYQWTGDLQLAKEIFPDLTKGIEWLLTTKDPDGNGYPNGSGMMEIPGLETDLEMIDVAVYTQQALVSASKLASSLGENELAIRYSGLANALGQKIDTQWWVNDQHSFGDFRASSAKGKNVLNAALIRSDSMKK